MSLTHPAGGPNSTRCHTPWAAVWGDVWNRGRAVDLCGIRAAVRSAPFLMKHVLLPVFKLVPGMSHTVGDGARRYVDAAGFGLEHSGKFFASKPKKMTGPLHAIEMDHFKDPAAQRALWAVTAKVSGGVGYPG